MKILGLQAIFYHFCDMQNGQTKYQENDIGQLVVKNQILTEENISLRTEVEYYKQELDKLKRLLFGSRSERYVPLSDGQMELGLDIEKNETKPGEPQEVTYTRTKPQKEGKRIPAVSYTHLTLPTKRIV